MLTSLSPQQLCAQIDPETLGFTDTSQLPVDGLSGWIGQADAEQAAKFGLSVLHPGFNLIVLGTQGSGRTTLMMSAMKEAALSRPPSPDLALLHDFEFPDKPLAIHIKSGRGADLRNAVDQWIRWLARHLPVMLQEALNQGQASAEPILDKTISVEARKLIEQNLDAQLQKLQGLGNDLVLDADSFSAYLIVLKKDVLENLELFIPNPEADNLLDSLLARYRLNLMVDNRGLSSAPVIYDADPTFQSLFGGYEGSADSNNTGGDFLRLRAGNVLRAHGGMLMLQLRDIQADQNNGPQILEKLYRVLRNHSVQIEESSGGSSQNSASHFAPESLPVEIKLVLIASAEDFYLLQDEMPDFAAHFPIKVEFSERFDANPDNYNMMALFIARECHRLHLPHLDAAAVAKLIAVMKRQIEDQRRIGANFKFLQSILLECATECVKRDGLLILLDDVQAVLAARYKRHHGPERQMLEAVVDGEVLVSVRGSAVGQVNGLTHIDLGEASFGSPVRITARSYAGDQGVINIDREVEMTGPNHDKGLLILKSWLSANFVHLTPLSLSASIVFEQEYHGVEGDSASCAELYALLSTLSSLPLKQGIAVTGALNQHGEVMPIGGVNEKIEGYFRICKEIGLDGTQGVIIPTRNIPHLMLADEVIKAVEHGQFHIYAIEHVLEGIAILTGAQVDATGDDGFYQSETVMGRVQQTLEQFRKLHDSNRTLNYGRS